VGDAAGMVNPFNGEGIAYAMEAGEIAAELIHDALVSDRPGIAHLYPAILRERYARYYRIGTNFVRAIGHPPVMQALTDYALPQEWLMRFMLRLMGNLTDGRKGDGRDKLMYLLERMTPVSR
jgi:flavin-dependent dehydrogenase